MEYDSGSSGCFSPTSVLIDLTDAVKYKLCNWTVWQQDYVIDPARISIKKTICIICFFPRALWLDAKDLNILDRRENPNQNYCWSHILAERVVSKECQWRSTKGSAVQAFLRTKQPFLFETTCLSPSQKKKAFVFEATHADSRSKDTWIEWTLEPTSDMIWDL